MVITFFSSPDKFQLYVLPFDHGSAVVFKDLDIKHLNIYFDNPVTLANELSLRGLPTTILFNKESKEFARIIGSIDFGDKEFLKWLKLYN